MSDADGLPLLDWRPPTDSRFNGADYQHERDAPRLTAQIGRVYDAMKDGRWHTLEAIADMTGDPTPSVSAQLRHLRKPRFGSHIIERQHIGGGLYEYRLAGGQ